jgi:hypothetical protein
MNVACNCVLFDDVLLYCRCDKPDSKVVTWRCKAISTYPVRTEPVLAAATVQSYAAAWAHKVAVADRDVVLQLVVGACVQVDSSKAVGGSRDASDLPATAILQSDAEASELTDHAGSTDECTVLAIHVDPDLRANSPT